MSTKRWLMGVAACVLLLSISVQAQEPPREYVLSGAVPWVQLDSMDLPYPYSYDNIMHGCRIWKDSAPVIVVESTTDHYWEVFTALVDDVHDVQFLPGIRTNSALLGQLDDPAGWELISKVVREAAQICNSHYVLIDMEEAWWDYAVGDAAVDWDIMQACLEQLPKDLHYIWYPARGTEGPDGIRMRAFLERVTQTVPDVTLVCFDWAWTADPASDWMQAITRDNETLAPCTSITYFYPIGPHAEGSWRWADITYILDNCPRDFFLVYPGAASFRRAGQRIGDILGN